MMQMKISTFLVNLFLMLKTIETTLTTYLQVDEKQIFRRLTNVPPILQMLKSKP